MKILSTVPPNLHLAILCLDLLRLCCFAHRRGQTDNSNVTSCKVIKHFVRNKHFQHLLIFECDCLDPSHFTPFSHSFLPQLHTSMGLRSLVSFGMIAIPIGATLGVLLGLDAHRSATGQTPLFQDNSVTTETYCQKAYGITPASTGQQYTCKSPPSSKSQHDIQQEIGRRPLLLSESAFDER